MSNMENYLRHQDVVTAVKQVLGIPQNDSLTTTLHTALQDGTQQSFSSVGKAEISADNESQLLAQEFDCLARTLPQLRESDTKKYDRLIEQLTQALHDNPAALELVKQLVA